MNNPTLQKAVFLGHPQIYTTGAFVSPVKLLVDGQERWFWKVDEFHDDCFRLGEESNPVETSITKAGLMCNVK